MAEATTSALPATVAGRRSARVVLQALFALTKPRIIELLLVTTVPTMMLAARGLPAPGLLMVTLAGGALAAGSANTINCYIDRDIDAVMRRTSRRPLARPAPLAVVKPAEALVFGIVLGAAATALLGLTTNWLAAALADAAILFYVFVYTIGLKRRTASNIVIGGAAGCFPVLVGWAAVTGSVSLAPILLFAVIFFWTPPHFWALAMKFRDDYAAVNVPMLPVVAPPSVVTRKILLYSYVMVATTLALAPYAGWVYTVFAAVLAVWFLAEAHRLQHRVATMTRTEPAAAFAGASPVLLAGAAPAGAASVGTATVATAPVATAPVATAPVATAPVATAPAATGPASAAAALGNAPEEGACAGLVRPSVNPAPMRLFHMSIAYLTLLFVVIAVTSVLPWGRW